MTERPGAVHHFAARGFDVAGEVYERGRPSYPQAAVDLLIAELGIGPGRDVLDLAAGTGKLTRLLAPAGARLVAVEPVAGMRRVLAGVMPGLRILDGVAEAIPLPDGALDAVVVGQAFHWFDAPAALAEIARVLRPGGRLGLVWNSRDESEPWVARLSALLDRHAGDAPRHRDLAWRPALAASPRFGPLTERAFRHDHAGTAATHRDRVASVSFIACLAPPERAAFLDEVTALLTRHADPDGLVMPYRTTVFWTALRA
ncbi:MAG: class I SAM-dependent methyltransferase [Egibacteraceae bacterium]